MSKYVRVFALPAIVSATLTACGGGGGGGSVLQGPGAGPAGFGPETPFTSFSATKPNTTAVMTGMSQTGSGTASAFKLDTINSTNSTARVGYDSAGNPTALSLSAPSSSVSFPSVNIRTDEKTGRRTAFAALDSNSNGVMVDPSYFGWNYQSFGIWMRDPSAASFQAGVMSAGAVTPGSAVPTMGSATFTGQAGGYYFDGAGGRFSTDAQMRAEANFQTRNIDFRTFGTLASTPTNPPQRTARPELDLSGNLSYAAGANQFSGNVSTANNALSGTASGRFYGPNAQEIGGVYGLSGSSGQRMMGAFGGKQQP
jgi:heat shock protein HslJ